MPPPSKLVLEAIPDIESAWRAARDKIQQTVTRPLRKVVVGLLSNPEHPSVKYGGVAGAYGLFADEHIPTGAQIGHYSGSLLMSEEMDANADSRLDGRYAVDFPLPPDVAEQVRYSN